MFFFSLRLFVFFFLYKYLIDCSDWTHYYSPLNLGTRARETVYRLQPVDLGDERKKNYWKFSIASHFNHILTIKLSKKKPKTPTNLWNNLFQCIVSVVVRARAFVEWICFTSITIYMQIDKLTCTPHSVKCSFETNGLLQNKQPYLRIFYVSNRSYFRYSNKWKRQYTKMKSLDWISMH